MSAKVAGGVWLMAFALSNLAAQAVGAAEKGSSLEQFLNPPRKDEEVLSRATPQERVEVQRGKGSHQNHRILSVNLPAFKCGRVVYRLSYGACLDREAHPQMVDLIAHEGLSGVGIAQPTSANWYGGGCLDVVVNSVSLGPWKPQIEFAKYKGEEEARFIWNSKHANVTLLFRVLEGDDKLLVQGTIEPQEELESVEVRLRCYPSGFTSPRDGG